jgi:L-cystine transport system permease protein
MDQLLDIQALIASIPRILTRLPVTVGVTFASMFVASLLGLFTALIKVYRIPILKSLTAFYVSFIRGTPLLVQLYLMYYGVPRFFDYLHQAYGLFGHINFNVISPAMFAIAAFSVNLGAYLSESIRAAIETVDRGQFEAAISIGMTKSQLMRKVVLPQALLAILPNYGNTLISTIKDTSLIFMISVIDIMGEAQIIGARNMKFFEVYIAVSLIYWATCIILAKILQILEKKAGVYERKAVD